MSKIDTAGLDRNVMISDILDYVAIGVIVLITAGVVVAGVLLTNLIHFGA